MGCLILLGLYFIIKNADKVDVDTLLDIIFVILFVVYGSGKLHLFV